MMKTAPTGLRADRRTADDTGSAMIMTLMVMVLVIALAATVSLLTIENLRSSWRSQQAGSALNAADAGVTRALTYLRSSGVAGLSCPSVCGARPEGEEPLLSDDSLPSTTGQSYDVWIQAVTPFTGSNTGSYRIWSVGRAAGEAERTVRVDVEVEAKSGVARGIFARQINGGGSASATNVSVFSTECVYDRDKINMTNAGIDVAYGIPAGVHSSSYVTTAKGKSNGKGQCSSSNSIHVGTDPEPQCSASYPFDHDRQGAPFTSDTCENRYLSALATGGVTPAFDFETYYPDGSRISTAAELYDLFDIDPELPDSLVSALKTMALSQGNLKTSASDWDVPDEDHAVMYFDLSSAAHNDRDIDLNRFRDSRFDPTTWDDNPADGGCPRRSLVIVVDEGNVEFNSNLQLAAALFLRSGYPYGQVLKANGTANFVGTIVADTVNLVGNVDLSLTQCFLRNTSPALLDVSVASYLEDDGA